jgi:hypothetical protein
MQRQKKYKEEMAQEIEDYVSRDEVLWRILKIVFILIIISEVRRLAMLGNIF